MIRHLVMASMLALSLVAPATAQSSRSPSGDPTGETRGVASDVDPVGKAVGNEPAMVDPHSTGSIDLDNRARIECTKRTADGKTITTHHTGKKDQAACKQ